MGQWQQIESAPKDGTEILVWDGFNRMVSSFIEPAGWVSWSLCAEEPTHWMPLPVPPAEEPRSVGAVARAEGITTG